ncbi:predicted protein [Botrytis cinerea T4]|uniref:Uncharacterized protein n=1 Tax=Botryotinia fuckeliana (strain T4) TaxID=999810 RepID=G2YXC9_BOTF4|nr:predicted protein [Botrytis cinerea T4]
MVREQMHPPLHSNTSIYPKDHENFETNVFTERDDMSAKHDETSAIG